jgi:hypothetical protein
VWILSQSLLEEQGCTVFSSLGEEGTWLGYRGQAYQCARPPRQTLVVGSVSQPGRLNLPAKDGEQTLLLLLDSGASVNVAGRHWERFLNVIPGVGTDVTAVGGGRVRSLGHGKLDIVFSVDSAHGTAHVLAAPLMVHHKPHKLHYLAASHWPATPKRLNELVASAYATVAGGSQVAYLDDNAAQAPPSPSDAAASAWASFLQGRGGAGVHGSGDAAWSTHVYVAEEEAPTVAAAARKAAAVPYPQTRCGCDDVDHGRGHRQA